jgi:replication initiation and membrane attachment protein DnaB
MNKQQALQSIEEIFTQKAVLLYEMEAAITASAAAKATVEVEELAAIDSGEYQTLTNDKNRKAFIKVYCKNELAAQAKAQEQERAARLQLSLVDNTIHMLALIAKINCEWSIEVTDEAMPF